MSVLTSRHYFSQTILITDDFGKHLLANTLKLPFDEIDLTLNDISNLDSNWWAAGKIVSYSLQDEPFIHIDSDVYFWDKLPERLIESRICAQSPEFFDKKDPSSYYKLIEFEKLISKGGGWLPEFWLDLTKKRQYFEASNCGIFGGNDIELIKGYAQIAKDIIFHKANHSIWSEWPELHLGNVLVEQFFLSLFLDYQNLNRRREITIEYIFGKDENPYAEHNNCPYYTHLISNSKSNSIVQRVIERYVLLNYPEYIPRTVQAAQEIENRVSAGQSH
ncbi:MAG: hypothetical protein K8R73_05765 [Clostridiales bacterium]|nr:hypothetical protein [Clostridiales bacterium]